MTGSGQSRAVDGGLTQPAYTPPNFFATGCGYEVEGAGLGGELSPLPLHRRTRQKRLVWFVTVVPETSNCAAQARKRL